MFKEIAVNGVEVANHYGGGYGGEWISASGVSGGVSSFDGGTWRSIDVPYWEARIKQIGKGKRHYFYLNKMWHYVELDEGLPPLLHYNASITKSPA